MIRIKEGIKTINIKNIIKQKKDKLLKFIKAALQDQGIGSIVIEVNDYNDNELICNISKSTSNDHIDLEEEMEPLLKAKRISLLELWRFDYDMFYVKKKDRVVVSEKRKRDIDEFSDYCNKKEIDRDDLLYTILTSNPD